MNAKQEWTFGGRGSFCGGRGASQTIPTSNPDQGFLVNDRQEQPIIRRGGARGGRGSLGSVSSATNLQQQLHSTRGRGEGLFGRTSSRGRFASGGNSTPLSESVSKKRQHSDENKTKNYFDRQEQPRSYVSNEEARKERPLLRYRPVDKPIEDIFAEDYECKEKYIDVTDNDDKVEITGVGNMMEMKFEKWEELNLHPQLYQNIKKSEYMRPRKIQSHVIPYIISGYDLKVHSETGSGKTAAFAIPIIQKILSTPECNRAVAFPAPFAIIIEPTRELCRQVYDQFRKFANDTFIKVCKIYGETNMNYSIMEIKRGCDILICTPGRIKHFIKAEFVKLSKMQFFVLDEADHMLNTEFLDDIRVISEFKSFPSKSRRQTLLFSATFPPEIQQLATEMLRDEFIFASNKKPVAPNSKIVQSFFQVQSNQKKDFLLELLGKELSTSEDKKNGKLLRALVFVETRRDSDVVSHYLVMNGIKSLSLNSNRSQPEREEALKKFDKGDIDVLVATDVCARGIDIKNLDHVINFDLPKDAVTYVHRIGRTGRLNTGYATNFVDTEMDSALIPSLVEVYLKIKIF
ncbi:hypothetical protein Mgra_00001771 [Meloidogyne graminicola]|uniref:RNA helicase n=1 Tax=Meloidogyne graminicola TaxID=189291 RepID=A0A8S9ZZI9_9BILA|nr:hypothetical protein Mgra_00001771 [Meloidogyne graminicola]